MNKFGQKSNKYLKIYWNKKKNKISTNYKKKEFHKRNNEQNIKLFCNERIILHFIKKYEAKNNNEKKKIKQPNIVKKKKINTFPSLVKKPTNRTSFAQTEEISKRKKLNVGNLKNKY